MLFLGTGAAELVPNPFCDCAVCSSVRCGTDRRDRRRRSALLLNAHTLLDCGPDVPAACGEYGVSLTGLRNVFVTHLHADHAALSTFEELLMTSTEPPQLAVHLSPDAYDSLLRLRDDLSALPYRVYDHPFADFERFVQPVRFEPYRDYTVDGMRVSAVYGAHSAMFDTERSLNYLFEKDGFRFLYALDTGIPLEKTYEYLAGRRLDLLAIDMTFGRRETALDSGHLNFANFSGVLERLHAIGALDAASRVLFTHIGMKCGQTHAQFAETARALFGAQIEAAYDGMQLCCPLDV